MLIGGFNLHLHAQTNRKRMTQIRQQDPVAPNIYTNNGNKFHLISMLFCMTSKLKALFTRVLI